MTKYLATYLTMILTMAILDFLWIGFIAKQLYQSGIGHLMAETPNLLAASAFYVVFCIGLLWFAILPHIGNPGVMGALLSASIFGFCAYATYDLSNLATLKGWPTSIALIDMAWGTLASVVAVAVGKTVFDKLAVYGT
jgi:uncharacterized membrane protein